MANIRGNYNAILNLAEARSRGARQFIRDQIRRHPEAKRLILDGVLDFMRKNPVSLLPKK